MALPPLSSEQRRTALDKAAVLAALPGIAKVRSLQIMKELGISESRRVRGLGSNQKELLLERFAPQS